jgi:hypothetical protein
MDIHVNFLIWLSEFKVFVCLWVSVKMKTFSSMSKHVLYNLVHTVQPGNSAFC